jgi:hypothetical protein
MHSRPLLRGAVPMDGIDQLRKAGEGPPSPSPPKNRAKSGSAHSISAAEPTAKQSRVRCLRLTNTTMTPNSALTICPLNIVYLWTQQRRHAVTLRLHRHRQSI